jgi:hypothetical protein
MGPFCALAGGLNTSSRPAIAGIASLISISLLRRTSASGKLPRVLQRLHSTSNQQPRPPLSHPCRVSTHVAWSRPRGPASISISTSFQPWIKPAGRLGAQAREIEERINSAPSRGECSRAAATGVNQPEADDLSTACFAYRIGNTNWRRQGSQIGLMSRFAPYEQQKLS